ncbi:MAG: YeeE/YedE thiosulfate transporter family protein [Arhodomonas sp.]|nr:YeeE/YedE thiosulfate transporter family protein [Arhodomonas sp.]
MPQWPYRRDQRHRRRGLGGARRRARVAVAVPGGVDRRGRAAYLTWPARATLHSGLPLWAVLGAGLLVGFGTRLGGGCTSGHGVCGLGRLSPRSLVAVITFVGTAVITVFVVRHVLGVVS